MILPDAKAYHSREPVVFKQSKIGSSDLELAFLSTPTNLSSLEQRYSLGIVQICFQPPELAVSDLLNILTVATFSALSTSTDATGVEVAILLFCELTCLVILQIVYTFLEYAYLLALLTCWQLADLLFCEL